MILRASISGLLGCLGFFTAACVPLRADASSRQNLNGGYFLLHDLLSDEENVPFLLDLKTSPKDLQDFAATISKTSKEGLAAMDRMHEANPSLNFDKNPLPKIEQDIRASIKDEKQHQLLFGTKGPDFARAFLVSQAEASKYAANIAKVLAQQDPDPVHQRDLTRMSARWHELYEQDFRLMRNH